MRTNLFVFLLLIILFSSCEESDLITKNEDLATLRVTPIPNNLGYENSIPIWRYYYYENSSYGDHYFGKERPEPEELNSIKIIKGRNYTYERQEFNILNQHTPGVTIALYRHRSIDNTRHRLSTSTNNTRNPNNIEYTNEELLGYIFQNQYPGTIPIREVWVIGTEDYSYVTTERERKWQEQYMPGAITSCGIIGYAYPGKRSETEGKLAETVTIAVNSVYDGIGVSEVKIRVKEELTPGIINDRILTYNININNNWPYIALCMYEEKTIQLAGDYTFQSMELFFTNAFYMDGLGRVGNNIITGDYWKLIDRDFNRILYKSQKTNNNYKFTFMDRSSGVEWSF